MSDLVIEGLTRTFEGAARPALADFDLHVEEGESVVLVGPSGCGKSTLLRAIAGLDTEARGRIVLGGRDLSGVPPQDRDVAMVFQGYALYPHRTARQNVSFPLEMRGMARAERDRRVDEVAELLGIGVLLGRYPSQLSGGERQRVAIARALVRRPKLFLFDEPLANLDAALRAELRVELAALVHRLSVTALFVTHDQAEAMTMGDRIAVLSLGRLQQVGTPRSMYERPRSRFVATFLGTPPMNVMRTRVASGSAELGGARIAAPPEVGDGEIDLAFRPERARLGDAATGDEARFAGKVAFLEFLGDETIVHLALGEASVRVRVAGFAEVQRGDDAFVCVAREHLAWYDAATGLLAGDAGDAAPGTPAQAW